MGVGGTFFGIPRANLGVQGPFLGVRGPFLGFKGHFWDLKVIFGGPRVAWEVQGPFWGFKGHFWGSEGHFWGSQGCLGDPRAILGALRFFLMEPPRGLRPVLGIQGPFGCLKPLLGHFERSEAHFSGLRFFSLDGAHSGPCSGGSKIMWGSARLGSLRTI